MNYVGARKDTTLYRPGWEATFSDIRPRKEMHTKSKMMHTFSYIYSPVFGMSLNVRAN